MKSEAQYIHPLTIHWQIATIEVDVINSNLPLLIAREEMNRLSIILHLDKDEIEY